MGLLDSLIYGYRSLIDSAGNVLPNRSQIKFANGTVTDDPVNGWTLVTGGSFTAPTGSGFVTVTGGVLDSAALAQPLVVGKGGTGTATAPGTNACVFYDGAKYAGITNIATDGTNGLQFLSTSGYINVGWSTGGATSGFLRLKSGMRTDVVVVDDGAGGNRPAILFLDAANANVGLGFPAYYVTLNGANLYFQTGSANRIVVNGGTSIDLGLPLGADAAQSLTFRFKSTAITVTGSFTLTSPQQSCVMIDLNGSPAAAFNMVGPAIADTTFNVKNNTGFSATVKTSASTGVVIAAGASKWVKYNSTTSDYEIRNT